MASDEEAGCGTLVFFALVAIAFVQWNSVWFTKLRATLPNNVNYGEIEMEPRPGDCDFFAAPIGRKACDYERQSMLVLYGHEPGTKHPRLSYDNGQTWLYADVENNNRPRLYLTWKKVPR